MICESHQICSLAAAVDYWQGFPLCIPLHLLLGPLDDFHQLHQCSTSPLAPWTWGAIAGISEDRSLATCRNTHHLSWVGGQGLYSPLFQAWGPQQLLIWWSWAQFCTQREKKFQIISATIITYNRVLLEQAVYSAILPGMKYFYQLFYLLSLVKILWVNFLGSVDDYWWPLWRISQCKDSWAWWNFCPA